MNLVKPNDWKTVLQFYVDAFPAFRSKPVGAPGSVEREAQSTHVTYEDLARALLGFEDAKHE